MLEGLAFRVSSNERVLVKSQESMIETGAVSQESIQNNCAFCTTTFFKFKFYWFYLCVVAVE